jgi:hypothetical protein
LRGHEYWQINLLGLVSQYATGLHEQEIGSNIGSSVGEVEEVDVNANGVEMEKYLRIFLENSWNFIVTWKWLKEWWNQWFNGKRKWNENKGRRKIGSRVVIGTQLFHVC